MVNDVDYYTILLFLTSFILLISGTSTTASNSTTPSAPRPRLLLVLVHTSTMDAHWDKHSFGGALLSAFDYLFQVDVFNISVSDCDNWTHSIIM